MSQKLIDKVLEQIKKDVEFGDLTGLECLLENLDDEVLKAYLPDCEDL